jgi:hypothetical protein
MMRNGMKILCFFCIVCVLTTAGCISQNSPSNTTGSSVTNTPVLTVVPTQCPPVSGNATPYIIINPIGNHTVGDVFEINGTTNLDVDAKIDVGIRERLSSRGDSDNPSGLHGRVTLQKNPCGPNFWSYSVNTSGWHYGYPAPLKYYASVGMAPGITPPYNQTQFFLYPVSGKSCDPSKGEELC